MSKYGRNRLHSQEYDLARLLGMQYTEALELKNEFMDLPKFITRGQSFSIYLTGLLSAKQTA